jgi:poly-gamma-glutamate synthesis protein (capsule biosynthesis protein)
LKCPPECIDFVKESGFDMALLGNNHIGDHGPDVAMETISHFNKAGIKTIGAGKNLAEANSPLKIQCQNINVAILNFAENEFGTAKKDSAGCAPLDPIENIKTIKDTAKTADLVFVIIHGGHERNPVPSPRMIKTYRAFAEAGASMVMNIHTHCPEGIELWNGVPIVYSPGNFFFPWSDLTSDHLTAMWWSGYLPKFHCDRDGVYALEIMPYRFDNERLYELTVAEKEGFYSYVANLNRLISEPEEVQRCFEGWVAQHGSFYISLLRDRFAAWPIDLDNRDAVRALLPPRNCFTCESHNDLITNYLRLIEENRVAKALKYWPKLEKFQHPDWADKYWQERLLK